MDEQTLTGAAALGYAKANDVALSVASDSIMDLSVEQLIYYAAMAGYSNGTYMDTDHNRERVRKALVPPPTVPPPTHALESPPDLTDGPEPQVRPANRLAALYLGPGPTKSMHLGGQHICSCGRPLDVTPTLHYVCLNDECPRYEEVRT